MAEPINKLMQSQLPEDFRPRYGTANQGYQMQDARQYPQPTTEDIIRLPLTGAGAGIGGFGAAPFLALAGATGSKGVAPGLAALGAIGAGGMAGRNFGNEVAGQYANSGDAQNQDGGFYGPSPQRWMDAEGQPGGFYGGPVNKLMR